MNDEEIKKILDAVITPNGLRVSGNGILAENTKVMIEKLDKIQKFLFFMEKRQNEMFEYMKSKDM